MEQACLQDLGTRGRVFRVGEAQRELVEQAVSWACGSGSCDQGGGVCRVVLGPQQRGTRQRERDFTRIERVLRRFEMQGRGALHVASHQAAREQRPERRQVIGVGVQSASQRARGIAPRLCHHACCAHGAEGGALAVGGRGLFEPASGFLQRHVLGRESSQWAQHARVSGSALRGLLEPGPRLLFGSARERQADAREQRSEARIGARSVDDAAEDLVHRVEVREAGRRVHPQGRDRRGRFARQRRVSQQRAFLLRRAEVARQGGRAGEVTSAGPALHGLGQARGVARTTREQLAHDG